MIKKIILILIFITPMIHSGVAPYFPEVNHSFVLNPIESDELSFVFNSKALKKSKKAGVSIAHQNREWDYNWFVLGVVIPTQIGHIGLGYSNYGYSSLPVTKSDTIEEYLDSYTSDTFENVVLAFNPVNDWVDVTFMQILNTEN